MKILETPDRQQIQVATEWLANHPHENPNLEIALNLIRKNQIIPHQRGGLVAIACTPSTTDGLSSNMIQGVVMASPGNANVSLESSDRATAESLFTLIQPRGCPRRVATSSQAKDWIRPLLVQFYQLEREHHPLVMICTHAACGGEGRWASSQDKPALQAYAQAYLAERGSGSLNQNWDDLIARQQVAVLEHNGKIVSVVKCSATIRHAIVVGTFTFPEFRKQGFACRLLAFFTQEMLKAYPAVKLWVDEDNQGAIALYRSLGFQQIGSCYTGYFSD